MDRIELKNSYSIVAANADTFKSVLLVELAHLLDTAKIALGVPLETRIKTWESINHKLERKQLEPEKLEDLNDLIGIRIILLFRKDLDQVEKLIRDSLTVLEAEDAGSKLTEMQFGYQSQHYVVEVPESWLAAPSRKGLGNFKVEIQVRTLAQHIWAAASHHLQYKREASVPLKLRRSINRASALLETVDIEFMRLLEEREIYKETDMISEGDDTPLNVETVEAILTNLFPSRNRGDTENYDELLLDINELGISSPAQLKKILNKKLKKTMESDAIHAEKHEYTTDYYFTHVGLAREALRAEFGCETVSDIMKARSAKKALAIRPYTGSIPSKP